MDFCIGFFEHIKTSQAISDHEHWMSGHSLILSPFQIIGHLTFLLTSSLTTRLVQKIYVNIVKFKSFLKNLYWLSKPQQKNNILHKFLNKTSDQ